MKKTSLWFTCAALITIMNAPVNAGQTAVTDPSQTQGNTGPGSSPAQLPATTPPISTPTTTAPGTTSTPGGAMTAPGTTSTPGGAMTAPSTTSTPGGAMTAPGTTQTPATTTPTSSSGNTSIQATCASPSTIDEISVLTWAGNAAIQIFSFDPAKIDDQMNNLKTCFTDSGWKSFTAALNLSGNIEAIKSLKLSVSSSLEPQGDRKARKLSDYKWKASLPLLVVYQNDKSKISQPLSVDVTIDATNGRLGIDQVLASPKANTVTPNQAAPSTQSAPAGTVTTPQNPNTGSQPATAPQ
ncbi:MAG: DotI/IcmL/TraM family protein [Legionella sp.]|nr:DotI/IcmL/TraM family protein [Legionella sp.]